MADAKKAGSTGGMRNALLAYGGIGLIWLMGFFPLYGPLNIFDGDNLKEMWGEYAYNIWSISPYGLDGAWVLFGFGIVVAAAAVWAKRKGVAFLALAFAFWLILFECIEWVQWVFRGIGDDGFFDNLWVPSFFHFLMLIGFAAAFWGILKMDGSLRKK